MTSKQHAVSHPRTQRPVERSETQSAESRLDEALQESFPASDPIAVDLTDPHHASAHAAHASAERRKRH